MLPSRQASEQFSSVLISLSRAERQAGKGKGRTRGKDRAKQAIIGGGSNDTVKELRRRGQMSGRKVGKEEREMVNGQAEKIDTSHNVTLLLLLYHSPLVPKEGAIQNQRQ